MKRRGGRAGANIEAMDEGQPAPRRSKLALIGLIFSLLGFLSCGLISPVGLVISIIAFIRRRGRVALIGIIVGALGSCGGGCCCAGIFGALGSAASGAVALAEMVGPEFSTGVRMGVIEWRIGEYERESNRLPDSLEELDLPADERVDGWGRAWQFHLHRREPGYELRSAGPDGQFDTDDDAVNRSAAGDR